MSNAAFLKVAVNVPLSREFDYRPLEGQAGVEPGTRVIVPFGRRRQVGIVMETADRSDLPVDKIRRCLAVPDNVALLSAEDLRLLRFTADYYHHPIGEVVAAALPALLRQGKPLFASVTRLAVSDAGTDADIETLSRRAPRQAELLELLLDAGGNGIEEGLLNEQMPTWRQAAKALLGKGFAVKFEAQAELVQPLLDAEPQPGPALNAEQEQAVRAVRSRTGFAAYLLDGVTGSGKTEVYLQLIRDVLAADRQVLILVPEIGLTPQLVTRLTNRLGVAPYVLHSALTDLERLAAWRAAREGVANLVVGTRSAVFTPLPALGLIVVDEEHDHSLKQQEGLRYSARDLAIVRARNAGVPVVLGSATPTLESLQHCQSGNYTHLLLPRRAGGAEPPDIRLVDIGRAPAIDGLSEPLLNAVALQLDAGGQVLMFLNRRGFAPTLICASCGQVAECARCDSRMTVHRHDRTLRCHHCGSMRPLPETCGECGAIVKPLGEGTQRLEESLEARFPAARIQRIDSDTTQNRGAIATALARAEQGEADILVGTQMLSKGHHFPNLTLVGIVNADQGLFGTDFRSSERLAQSIIQVAGRAGREARRGEVIVQTAFPEHPFWERLIHGGYPQIAADALAEREQSRWPPFTRLALLRAAATDKRDAHAFLESAARRLSAHNDERLRVLGPVDAPMARKAGRFRAQLLVQSANRKALHGALAMLRPCLEEEPVARKVRWSIDVDPIELF